MPGKKLQVVVSEISKLPETPGVYVFYNRQKQPLYIGKAANLKERVKSHFRQPRSMWEQTLLRQGFGGRLGFIKTKSEIEALILEAKLIKKYRPKFNIVWRDDKNYFYVAVSKEEFPRIFLTHQLKIENCKLKINYVGPFVDGTALKQTLKVLRRALPFRSCSTLPKKPCLWYQLDRCPAPCLSQSMKMKRVCQRNTKNLIKILQGKKTEVLQDLQKEMKKLSKEQEFELAAKIRDQIEALEKVLQHAKIFSFFVAQNVEQKERRVPQRIEAYDVSNIQGVQAAGAMVVFKKGKPNKQEYRKFRIKVSGKPDDIAMLKEVLKRRFGHPEWRLPDLILIDGGKAQLNAAKLIVKQFNNSTIKVIALAKKKNELYLENKKKPLLLKNLPPEIANLILRIRDEAHRFAVAYHKKLRRTALFNV